MHTGLQNIMVKGESKQTKIIDQKTLDCSGTLFVKQQFFFIQLKK